MAKRLSGTVQRAGFITSLARNARLSWRLMRDPRVTMLTKLVVPGIFLAYMVSPAGLLNAVPIVGEIDDMAVAALALNVFIRLAPRPVVAEHRARLSGQPMTDGDVMQAQYRAAR